MFCWLWRERPESFFQCFSVMAARESESLLFKRASLAPHELISLRMCDVINPSVGSQKGVDPEDRWGYTSPSWEGGFTPPGNIYWSPMLMREAGSWDSNKKPGSWGGNSFLTSGICSHSICISFSPTKASLLGEGLWRRHHPRTCKADVQGLCLGIYMPA